MNDTPDSSARPEPASASAGPEAMPPEAASAQAGSVPPGAGPDTQTAGAAPRTSRWTKSLDEREGRLKLAIGVLAVLLAVHWWNARTDISDLRRDVAQRLQSGETMNSQTKLIADRVDDDLRLLQGKVALLEAKQGESQSQQIALEQLYRDLAKNRDDWALAEIEQVLSTASQQLQLAGNVRGALIALQNADTRLSRADRPQFIDIRRAIAQDMEKLKSLPSVDLTGVAVRLDALINQIEAIPLLADEKPAVVAPVPSTRLAAEPRLEPKSAYEWRVQLQEHWTAWALDLWSDIRELVRVRTVNHPEALLLTPEQAFFARENLKLRLLNARVALLSRNDAAFRSDLAEADRALVRYFDPSDRRTRTAREIISQLQQSVVNIDMPTLANSLAAVRQTRTRP